MWGGRFAEGPAAVMREINASIPFDKRLWRAGHRRLAGACRDAGRAGHRLRRGCERRSPRGSTRIAAEYRGERRARGSRRSKTSTCTTEARLAELIGPAAGRLHTARSRNDQVATDFRLWVRDAIDAGRGGAGRVAARAGRARRASMPTA